MPEDLTEDRRDLLAYASFRISPRTGPPYSAEEQDKADSILSKLLTGVDGPPPHVFLLERRVVERLVPIVGIPLEVKIFARRGLVELGLLILGSYALLKDYKPLRESLDLLAQDIRNLLLDPPEGETPAGIPPNWDVEVVDFRIPGTTIPETFGGFVGMGVVSRYALVYLLIINFIVLIFFCYLTLTAVIANT